MTLEQQESFKRELDGAMASGDKSRIDAAMANILIALIECQRKTADRVKELVADKEAVKNKKEGLRLGAMLLKAAINIGGPTGAIILCKLTGILW